MRSEAKDRGRRLLAPVARLLANIGISPNLLTALGLVASALAGVLIAGGRFQAAAVALLVGGLCDVFDGAVARATGKSSTRGAFLDSTVDRLAEMFFFAGVLFYFVTEEPSTGYALLTFLAAGGSFMVSYIRARSEGLGIPCTVGWMERPERMVVLILASLLGPSGIRAAMWVLTVLVFWTSFQRMQHVYRETRSP
jgi:CDP-diacylglycerol--glycerol-3-phosphate 3-phosphatidyltransferase